jgi:hypothetical protein
LLVKRGSFLLNAAFEREKLLFDFRCTTCIIHHDTHIAEIIQIVQSFLIYIYQENECLKIFNNLVSFPQSFEFHRIFK